MLHIIKGRAGTGKSSQMRNILKDKTTNNANTLLYIVPDNITFDTQKEFLDEYGSSCLTKFKVMGFTSLCDYVFQKTGNRHFSFADDGAKHVIMNMALYNCQDKLDLFKNKVNSNDMNAVMLETLSNFKHRNISVDLITDAVEKCENEKLKQKLSETGLVLSAYESLLQKSYLDPLDSITKVTEILRKEKLFEGFTIFVDSHKSFTKQQYLLLTELLIESKDFYITFMSDLSVGDTDIFSVNDSTEYSIKEIAKKENIDIAPAVVLDENYRFLNEELIYIEKNLYRNDKDIYDKDCENVELYKAQSIYEECDYVARNIRRLVSEENYRYKDIAVLSRHPEKYSNILDLAFEKYNISYFISQSENIDTKPLVKFISSVFSVYLNRYEREDILTLLKTKLTPYTQDEITEFENYLFIWDINGKDFFSEFKMHPRGYADEFTDNDKKVLDRVEKMRRFIIETLYTFFDCANNQNGKVISTALMDLIYKFKVDENIIKLADKYEESDVRESEKLYRMWDIFVDVLEKMVYITKDFNFTLKRFYELLYIHISNTEISYIPSGIDQVTLYDVTTLSMNDKKVVFVLGCNDGEFPENLSSKSLFSDSEIKILDDMDIHLEDKLSDLVSQEKLYVYVALTRAREKLFISYYKSEINGDTIVPSSIFDEVELALSKVKEKTYEEVSLKEHLYSDVSAFEYLTENYKKADSDENIKQIKEYFSKIEKYRDIEEAIDFNIEKRDKKISDKELAKSLFKNDMKLSASQVDEFYQCKFMYFIDYGLRVRERRQAKIDALEYGTLVHYVFESFIRNHKNDDFSTLKAKDVESEVERILSVYAEVHLGGLENKSSEFIYLFSRMQKTIITLILHMIEELSQSSFVPSDFELNIGNDIPEYTIYADDDVSVSIRGSVDRVDIMEKNDEKYVRVIDYKTGSKEFSLSNIIYGLNLQMFIYMAAINANGKDKYGDNITPSAVLYAPSKISPVKAELNMDEEKIKKARDKQLVMFGVVLDDKDVIRGMDKNADGTYIKVKFKKDGNYDAHSFDNIATIDEMGLLFKEVDRQLENMAKTLLDGDINDVPTRGEFNACYFCKYKSVCNHEDIRENNRYIKKLSKVNVYDKIREEGGMLSE